MVLESGMSRAFNLPKGIRPGPQSRVVPEEGYRHGVFKDSGRKVPMLAASVSAERLFDVFCDLLSPFGETVDVYLQRHAGPDKNREMLREGVELPILLSNLCGAEDLLVNDGATGLVVCANPATPMTEVHFDDHKALIVYAYNLTPFMEILESHGIPKKPNHRLVLEEQHVHLELPQGEEAFEQLAQELSMFPVPEKIKR